MDNNRESVTGFWSYLDKHPGKTVIGLLALLALAIGVIYFAFKTNTEISTPLGTIKPSKKQSLDTAIFPGKDTTAVKIENPAVRSLKGKATPVIKQSNKSGKNEANVNQGTNKGNIGGENNKVDNRQHIINGDNIGGVNGDININQPIRLGPSDINILLERIHSLEIENKTKYKYFQVSRADRNNNEMVAEDIYQALKSSGFIARMQQISIIFGDDTNGVLLIGSQNDSTVSVIVGKIGVN